MTDRSVSVPMTLSDLGVNFQADLLNNARILFNAPRERGPSVSLFWGFLSIYAYTTLLLQNYQI